MRRMFVSFAALLACSCSSANAPAPAKTPAAQEISITSKSPEAVEHFKKGRDLAENIRTTEAAQEFEQALKLDGGFALARAYHGAATPGAEGLKEIEQASQQAGALPKPEHLLIDATLANRRGEFDRATALWKELTEAAPNDWRAYAGLGGQLTAAQKYKEAAEAMKRATELNPKAGPVFNQLGYVYLFQGEVAPAIEALKQYASLNPDEPNPQDSLGEALMAGGQFADAEAAFLKARTLAPQFWIAWEGVAYTKFFAGDWAAGKEALIKAREAASRPSDKTDVDRMAALAALAEGKTADGMKQLDTIEKAPGTPAIDAASIPIFRGMALLEASRYADALAEAAKAAQRADSGELPAVASSNLRGQSLMLRVAAESRMGSAPAAGKTVAVIEKETAARPDDPQFQSLVHLARGLSAALQKDGNAAKTNFDQCSNQDTYCHWQAFVVTRKIIANGASDGVFGGINMSAAGRISKVYVRDPVYLYIRSMLKMPRKAAD